MYERLAQVGAQGAEDAFRLAMIGAEGDLRVFWLNGLVGTITTLALHPAVLAGDFAAVRSGQRHADTRRTTPASALFPSGD